MSTEPNFREPLAVIVERQHKAAEEFMNQTFDILKGMTERQEKLGQAYEDLLKRMIKMEESLEAKQKENDDLNNRLSSLNSNFDRLVREMD